MLSCVEFDFFYITSGLGILACLSVISKGLLGTRCLS